MADTTWNVLPCSHRLAVDQHTLDPALGNQSHQGRQGNWIFFFPIIFHDCSGFVSQMLESADFNYKISPVCLVELMKTLSQSLFISPSPSDDVIWAPDLQLAAAASRCTSEALSHFCWTFETTQWDGLHSQGSCFLHSGLYRSLEPGGIPQAVSTVPAPCTVVQAHRWEKTARNKEVGYFIKSGIAYGTFYLKHRVIHWIFERGTEMVNHSEMERHFN